MAESVIVRPGLEAGEVKWPDGRVVAVPEGWVLVRPGDAALTRRVKEAGESWTVQEKVGRKTFSRGVWAPGDVAVRVMKELEAERANPAYAKKLEAGRKRREKKQVEYIGEFVDAVKRYLGFDARYRAMEEKLAQLVAEHATPVGSGTVARTERIPIEQRAEAAVIAWMRHRTTGYDGMMIARVKGERREVRRMLAERSRRLLEVYRRGEERAGCPLKKALDL